MAVNAKDLIDIGTEGLMIGCFLNDPSLLLDFYDKLYPHDYYFSNEATIFLYRMLHDMYLVKKYQKIDETKINIYLEEKDNEEKKKLYKKWGGWSTLKRLKSKAEIKEIDAYYEKLTKYAVLRQLNQKNFPINPLLEKVNDLSPEDIIDTFEYTLNEVQMQIKGINHSVVLGQDMVETYEQWKVQPDFGISFPFPTLTQLTRGWRTKKLYCLAIHSGYGKSRMMSRVAVHVAIQNKTPILIMVNEQDAEEWKAMILSSVVNNIFYPQTKVYVDETKIVSGTCNEVEDKICRKAAKWIADNTNIYFQELQKWDFGSLKRIIKKHKLAYGVNHFIVDTFKPMRFAKMGGMANWEKFVESGRMIKDLCREMDIAGFITAQLTDESLNDLILTSQSLANGKHLKHDLDVLLMCREMNEKEKELFYIDAGDYGRLELEKHKQYYMMFIDKNRGGKDHIKLCFECDRGLNLWIERGFLKFGGQAA